MEDSSSKGILIYEDQSAKPVKDPDSIVIQNRRLITQPYDLVIEAILAQINQKTLHLRPLSGRPKFQRGYVWDDNLASLFVESILLNIPIPPCFLSQNEEFELDVIDGQQRMYSLYRFADNQFQLNGLEILTELNGKYYYELEPRIRRRFDTYTLRCVIVTNDSDPEIKFDVFERLNTNTVPLNAQEIRNCVYRGPLNDLLVELGEDPIWLKILNRSKPDKRMRGEELILRFFAFYLKGVQNYKTPQKFWLNDVAKEARRFSAEDIAALRRVWHETINKCLAIFNMHSVFRRIPKKENNKRNVINRALMDLTMLSLVPIPLQKVEQKAAVYVTRFDILLRDPEFDELITRAIDHKSRTVRRFELWNEHIINGLF